MNKITITGDLGSGKSAVSRLLCEATGYAYVSTGQIQRQIAAEMGIDTLELNRLADTDPSIDERIDRIFIELGDAPGGYVVDSRLAWFFLPNAFKVYLQTTPEEAVRRIWQDTNRKSESYASVEDALIKIRERKHRENERFWKTYGADCTNMQLFDVVIDTTRRSPEDVTGLVLQALQARQLDIPFNRYWQ